MLDQELGLLEKSIREIKAIGLDVIMKGAREKQKQNTTGDEWWRLL